LAEIVGAREEDVKEKDSRFQSLVEMEMVLSVASNADALKIFYAAKEGIKSSTQAIKELDLTQKKYYTHLKNLIEVGLIEKAEDTYQQTTLGKICYKLTEALNCALSQKERLDLVDRISKTKNISLEETEEIMHAILRDANIVPGEHLEDFFGPVRMADTWDKVMDNTIEFMEKAEKEIEFATQYVDAKVIDPILEAAKRGIKMRFIVSQKENYSMALQMFKGFLSNPRILKTLFDFLRSNNVQIRYIEVPYSLIVVDRKYAMVEVATPYTKTFSLAFFFTNSKVSEKLVTEFDLLWEKGSDLEKKLKTV